MRRLVATVGMLLFGLTLDPVESQATPQELVLHTVEWQSFESQRRVVIQEHLSGVEQELRSRDVSHLSDAQRAARTRHLDRLHTYWKAGIFPHNHRYPVGRARAQAVDGGFPENVSVGRTPIFVDEHGTHCAVGYLMAEEGDTALVSAVVGQANDRYVLEMSFPELLEWSDRAGFSVDELAMIQPSYDSGPFLDSDGDGWPDNEDCQPENPAIHPGATEICNDRVDNDCDFDIDEEVCDTKGCFGSKAWIALLPPVFLLGRRRRVA